MERNGMRQEQSTKPRLGGAVRETGMERELTSSRGLPLGAREPGAGKERLEPRES